MPIQFHGNLTSDYCYGYGIEINFSLNLIVKLTCNK